MQKILYISYNDVLGYLGYSQIIPYIKGLRKFEYEFTVISYEREKILQQHREYMSAEGIEWKPLRYHQKPSLLATTYDVFIGIVTSIVHIRKSRISIIHARSYVPAFIGMVAKAFTGCKLIFDMRGFLADEYAEGGSWDKREFKYKLVKYFEKKLLKASDEIITLTNAAKEILIDQFGVSKEITVIPCCVDTTKFINIDKRKVEEVKKKLGLENKIVMVYAGSLGGWYLTKEMVDFFCEVKKNIEKLHFLVLSNSRKEIIQDFFIKSNVDPETYTIIKVKPNEMPEYLSVADFSIAFIIPSYSKKASSPIKFGEYLAVGLPIITNSGIGDSDEMIGEKVGFLVKEFSIEEYNNAINSILMLIKDKVSTSEEFRKVVAKYLTHEFGIQAYERVYKKLHTINKNKGDN